MHVRKNEKGNALIMAIIAVVVCSGAVAAILTESIFFSKAQFATVQAEKARQIVDATLERVRRALFIYRAEESWDWSDIITYCSTVTTNLEAIEANYIVVKETDS